MRTKVTREHPLKQSSPSTVASQPHSVPHHLTARKGSHSAHLSNCCIHRPLQREINFCHSAAGPISFPVPTERNSSHCQNPTTQTPLSHISTLHSQCVSEAAIE